jgi:hypothetical protein
MEEIVCRPDQECRELASQRDENRKLKLVVADLTLDRYILQEIVRNSIIERYAAESNTSYNLLNAYGQNNSQHRAGFDGSVFCRVTDW